MKFCQEHWKKLKEAVKEKGMGHLISTSAEELAGRIRHKMEGIDPPDEFDPLFHANMGIMQNALMAGGIYLLLAKEDGSHFCPLCEAEENGYEDWIELATEECLEHCKQVGLLS